MSKMIDNYVLHQTIGQGQYGKVYKAVNSNTNQVVAIKVIKLERFKQVPKLTDFTINEINTLQKIQNENIIGFIEMLRTVNNIYLVYDFCNQGNLEQQITQKGFLQEKEALSVLDQLLNAFEILVKERILHRDLKPSNILLHDGKIKLADFGFCKTLTGPMDLTQTMVGSPIYMAPEILKGEPYTLSADIWSLGVCFFEMLFGRCPFEETTIPRPLEIPYHIQKISEGSEWLLRKMLIVDPLKRITWTELFEIYNMSKKNEEAIKKQQQNISVPLVKVNSSPEKRNQPRSPSPILVRQQGKSPARAFGNKQQQITPKNSDTKFQSPRVNSSPFLRKLENVNKRQQELTPPRITKPVETVTNSVKKLDNINEIVWNLRMLKEKRNLLCDKQKILVSILELNDNNYVSIFSFLLVKQIKKELEKLIDDLNSLSQPDGWNIVGKWADFRSSPSLSSFIQIHKDDLYKISLLEQAFIRELERIDQRIYFGEDSFLKDGLKYLEIIQEKIGRIRDEAENRRYLNHERDVRKLLLDMAGIKNFGINSYEESRDTSLHMKKLREIISSL